MVEQVEQAVAVAVVVANLTMVALAVALVDQRLF
jgi:hypothetical protein